MKTIQIKTLDKGLKKTQTALVLTHKDLIQTNHGETEEHYIEKYVKQVIKVLKKHGLCSYLPRERIFVTDNKTGEEEKFEHLRGKLFHMMNEVYVKIEEAEKEERKAWGLPRPLRWLLLSKMIHDKNKGIKFVKREEITEIAAGFAFEDAEIEGFLRFQHTMGEFVYYPEETLREYVITDPQWLVDIFKMLIVPEEFVKKKKVRREESAKLLNGKVTTKILKKLWAGNDVLFLTKLLTKFKLILPLKSEGNTEGTEE